MKKLWIILLSTFSLCSLAQNYKGSFYLEVEGTRSQLGYIKTSGELTMARSTRLCRGMKMPKPKGEWSCKSSAPRVSACRLEYSCHFLNKNFNRVTESRRLRTKLKSIPHLKASYTIALIQNDQKKILKKVDGSKVVAAAASTSRVAKAKKVRKPTPQRVRAKAQRSKRVVKKETINKSKQEDLEEVAFLKEDDSKKLLSQSEESLEEVVEQSENSSKKESRAKQVTSKRENEFLDFSLSYISISDDQDNSLTTFGLAWTPHYFFSNSIGLRGEVGFHSYKTPETELLASESFLIYDLGLYASYNFTNIYIEAGFGLQMWNGEGAENANFMAFGGGYRFDETKLYLIDRISFAMSSLSNDIGTKELKFSIGSSF
ncbi:hypothetical protein [Halobacteriovorax marinus]|uniref:hypothetical protein n=1 Tax=Halobacteriovorax marinus TaxID=97084 RepID=UPI0012FDE9C8|nr:hypothetical protein [Halobacteriovorax marinus]